MSGDLVAFLRARLDEDQKAAYAAAHQGPDDPPGDEWTYDPTGPEIDDEYQRIVLKGGDYGGTFLTHELGVHIARHDPARVLADVEAKRRIIDLHTSDGGNCRTCCGEAVMQEYYDSETAQETVEWERSEMSFPCPTLRLLALPHADHPDYDEAWRP